MQVHASYKKELAGLPAELMSLLDAHGHVLAAPLRKGLATALILLRNRGALETHELVPLFFRLFRVQDKALRSLLYRHIVADIRAANRKRCADGLNRKVQGYLHGVLGDPEPVCAKKGVALLSELYRRGVWSDARCVNIVALAAFHPAPPVRAAALRFFLGADDAAAGDGESDDDDGSDADGDGPSSAARRRTAEAQGAVGLTKEQIYAAYSKGTLASKKKKQAKLKREIARVRKRAKREEAAAGAGGRFGALQLLHDPQGFAEKLFGSLQGTSTGWETRLLQLQVLSRVVGTHKLLLLNLYPFLQRYAQPSSRDATRVLAAAAQAVHDEVPPDALQPLLRTLVDAFVHDRARPEVVAVGLAAVREIALRQPLVMSSELLRDLALYKKHKDKGVASAARSLVMMFRELAPDLLEKRDRGKGHVAGAAPAAYGAAAGADRVPGAQLLQAAEAADAAKAAGLGDSGSERGSDDSGSGSDDDDDGSDDDASGSDDDDEEMAGGSDGEGAGRKRKRSGGSEDEEEAESDGDGGGSGSDEEGSDDEASGSDGDGPAVKKRRTEAAAEPGSLRSLKRANAAAAALAAAEAAANAPRLETERFLTDEDFARIRAIRAENAMQDAMRRMGAKRAAAAGADAVAALVARRGTTHERRVAPESLQGTHRHHSDKAERLARVHAGREGRAEFGSASERHKKKVGGSSNKEKAKKKAMPLAARMRVASNRRAARHGAKGARIGTGKSNKNRGSKHKNA
jgi:protein SDA1